MAPPKPASPKTAPPTVTVTKTSLHNSDTTTALIKVSYEVLADGKSTDEGLRKSANTKYDLNGGITDALGISVTNANGVQESYRFPGYGWGMVKGKKVVTELKGRFELIVTVSIQTEYGPDSKADQPSAYGRGTTPADITTGDTSLGFHESCHREDMLEYLKKNSLPTYRGKTGITEQEFQAAGRTYKREYEAYFEAMKKFSSDRTDETGYTRTEYKTKGPKK